MNPHWHNEDGALCSECAGDVEGDLNTNEVDSPEFCVKCGRLTEYTLTEVGVKEAFDMLMTSLEEWPAGNARLPEDWRLTYWRGSREIDDVREMAEDLQWYQLDPLRRRVVSYFLTLTKDKPEESPTLPEGVGKALVDANRLLGHLSKTVNWGSTFDLDIALLNHVMCELPKLLCKYQVGNKEPEVAS